MCGYYGFPPFNKIIRQRARPVHCEEAAARGCLNIIAMSWDPANGITMVMFFSQSLLLGKVDTTVSSTIDTVAKRQI